ncbi:spore coat protein [Clostridium saccharobutylicum]|uniref:Coat F domain-containing protein n=1 Tax=Clostridium saccharobutylicum DSM 13864 TaxID=1345695 RepID=U5MUG5_CLOSA|nr:spore coat protein [Clostridium saccharobutylicum]AGX44245.1 coat F domain-containing protein [Clostridium saccharobutylicum DSM 13864]AQR91534.1 coat F domain protein [Clostridium saccharobutylicum]AQS01439.1 coat F domain protein [Clostridium saccharobutylicum]AQS11048.1 coat F domain protein [Clostridium saccharobutylicum]AQS15422.1 coat F domain protein [Clostridium saccharobutylicum]
MVQNSQLTEKDIALDLLTSSKASIATLTKVLTETTNPQLRDTLKSELTTCINSHYRLSDLSINKGWYNAQATPEQQLQQDLSSINSIVQ